MTIDSDWRNFTPLHHSVIDGNWEKTQRLLESGASVNAQDIAKWTPLHHAIVRIRKPNVEKYSAIVELLKKFGADEQLENECGASAQDFENFCIKEKKARYDKIPVQGEDGQLLTSEKFKELTGATYIKSRIVSKKTLLEGWDKRCRGNYAPFIEKILESFASHSPLVDTLRLQHVLKPTRKNDAGQIFISSPGLGLFASKDWEAFQLMGEYLGKEEYLLRLKEGKTGNYMLGGLDAEDYGNEISRINDGFPNIAGINIKKRGRPERNIFVTCEPIKEGSEYLLELWR
jgi:hypothetical protein